MKNEYNSNLKNIISKLNLISPKGEPSNAISRKSRGGGEGIEGEWGLLQIYLL